MKALVTGGCGFIGSHLCERLVREGHEVVAIDNMHLGSRDNVAHLITEPAFELHEFDLLDQSSLDELVTRRSVDIVFHLAANSDIRASAADPRVDVDLTLMTTIRVLEAMRHADIPKIAFASSSAIYGEAPGQIVESYGPLKPISHYGAAKLASEAFISSYCANYGFEGWIARFPNVVGERATHGAIIDFAAQLRTNPGRLDVLGDGRQTKPYLHAGDLVAAILTAVDKLPGTCSMFNLAGDTRTSVARIAEIVAEESGTNPEIRFLGGDRGWVGDVPYVEFDTTVARSIGWKPELTSEEAVRVAARWALGGTR